MNNKGRIFALAITVILLATLVSFQVNVKASSQRTIVVPDDFSTIQDAINNASSGDTVLVREGNYNTGLAYVSPLSEGNLYIDKPLKLIGQDSQTTIINTKTRITYGSGLLIKANDVTVSGFTIKGDRNVISVDDGSATISYNIIELTGDSSAVNIGGSSCQVLSNTITGFNQGVGISLNVASGLVSNNFINGFEYGISGTGPVQIISNTLSNNMVGFMPLTSPASFSYNNIINNAQNSIFSNIDINAPNNWWGTTDPEAINQTIAHYNPINYPLGNIVFIPFLNESNPQAMPNPRTPITIPTTTSSPTPSTTATPIPTPSTTQTSSPSIPEFSLWTIPLILTIMLAAAGLLVYHKKHKHNLVKKV